MLKDFESHDATSEVARDAGDVVSQQTNTTEHEDAQDLPLGNPDGDQLLRMSAMSPDVAHAALGPDKLLSMGEVSLDVACSTLERFEMDWIEAVAMMEQWEMQNERDESLICSEGECEGEIVGGTCVTPASARSQHDGLDDELTHLVDPLLDL